MTEQNFDMNYLINSQYSPTKKEPDQFNFALSGAMYIENPTPVQQSETELIGLAMAEQVDLEEDDDADDRYFCDLCDADDGFGDDFYDRFTTEESLEAPLLESPWKWNVQNSLDTQLGYGASIVNPHVVAPLAPPQIVDPTTITTSPVDIVELVPQQEELITVKPEARYPSPQALDYQYGSPVSPESDAEYQPDEDGEDALEIGVEPKPTRKRVRTSKGTSKRQRREKYVCQVTTGGITCGKTFGRPYDLERHADIHNPNRQTFHCKYCPGIDKLFSRQDALTRHIKNKHGLDE